GLGGEARTMPDELFLVAGRAVADHGSAERLASGALYPSVDDLRPVTRAVALAVARIAVAAGVGGVAADIDGDAAVDARMWWPGYVRYVVSADRRFRND